MTANPARGEATVKIGGGEYVLAAEMKDLAVMAEAVGDPPMNELFGRLMGGSIHATRVALGTFVQRGTAADGRPMKRAEAAVAALRDFTLADVLAVQRAFNVLFEPLLIRNDEPAAAPGNGPAAPA